MPVESTPADLATRIQQLLEERQEHADAVARIDQTLERVLAALGGTTLGRRGRSDSAPATVAEHQAQVTKRGRRGRRGKFATSAEDSILAFIREHRDPTTQEVKQHFKREGRGGTADNVLSKLFKDRKVRRTPLGDGQRGSRYSLA